jgi:HEAT repeat protein
MRATRLLTCAVLATAVAAVLGAQDKELTVEQLFLKNVEYQVLREQAYSNDYEAKMSALDSLANKMSGQGAPPPEAEPILEYLSLEGTGHRVRQEGKLINYFPDVRRRACALLAKVNDEQSAYALITVLLTDDESMVTAEAAYSLGALSLSDNAQILQALTLAVSRADHTRPDNSWAYAILTAFERQSRRGIDQASFQAIITLATGAYSRTVRDKAYQVLANIKG